MTNCTKCIHAIKFQKLFMWCKKFKGKFIIPSYCVYFTKK